MALAQPGRSGRRGTTTGGRRVRRPASAARLAARAGAATPRWAQPAAAPGWAPPPDPASDPASRRRPTVPPGMPVAHKPGAIPLRPLVLSDIFDGAFRIIRLQPEGDHRRCGAGVRRGDGRPGDRRAACRGRPAGSQPRPGHRRPQRQPAPSSLLIALGGRCRGHPAAVDRAAVRLRHDRPRDARPRPSGAGYRSARPGPRPGASGGGCSGCPSCSASSSSCRWASPPACWSSASWPSTRPSRPRRRRAGTRRGPDRRPRSGSGCACVRSPSRP